MKSDTLSSLPPASSPSPSPQLAHKDVSFLSSIERLILAQAVYEYGANDWEIVSQLLCKHPCSTSSKQFFTPQSCQIIYTHLMDEASLPCSNASNVPHAPLNLKLAQRHYSNRLLELRDLILAEEIKFRRVIGEINEIRSGAWDDKIKAKLSRRDPIDHPPQVELPPAENDQVLCAPEPSGNVGENPTSRSPDGPSIQEEIQLFPAGESSRSPQDAENEMPDTTVAQTAAEVTALKDSVSESPLPSPGDHMDIESQGDSVQAGEADKQRDSALSAAEALPLTSEEVSFTTDIALTRESKRKASDTENLEDTARGKKRSREESASTDMDEQGSTAGSSSRRRGTTSSEQGFLPQILPALPNKKFQTVIGMLHSQISQHRNGNIFHNPIKSSEAPDYHEIIKRPMDLKTIKARIKDGVTTSSLEFQRDVYLMFANAMMYNRPGSDIFQMAEEMMLESEVHINTFRQTEGFVRSAHRS